MLINKITRKTYLLFNPKIILMGILLSLIFLKLNSSLDDTLTFVIVSSLLIYLCIGLTYRVYKYFKKDHILVNVLVLLLLSGILAIAIDSLYKHQQDIPFLIGFKGDAIFVYMFIAFVAFVLVLIKLLIKLVFTFVKKRADTVKLFFAILVLFISIFIFYPPRTIAKDSIKLYYQTLNPKAGLVYYEKMYKDETSTAERYRTQVNNIMDELQQNGQAQKSDEYLLNLLKGKKTQIDKIFKNREQSLKRLIEIDKLAQNIRLTKSQKAFYEKRKLADENELKAFLIYKLAQDRFVSGSITFYGFWNLFHTAVDSAFSPDQNLRTTSAMSAIEKQVNGFYGKEIKNAKNNKILSGNIIEQINHGYDVLTKLFEYQKFSLTKPTPESLNQKVQEMIIAIKEQGDSKLSNTDMFMEWIDTFVKPGIYIQDKEHQKSFYLFKDAYEYAKKQKMDLLFTVWNNDYPGYEKPQIEPATLKNSKEAVEGYYKIYENPMVKYIRTTLNAYLQGDPQSIIPQLTKEKNEDANYIYGLDSFDKEYYNSKFVVILKEDYPYGGNQFTILFQDKSDRFFTAWIYEKPDKTYELRGFSSSKKQRQADIDKVNIEFKDFLMDKEHSM